MEKDKKANSITDRSGKVPRLPGLAGMFHRGGPTHLATIEHAEMPGEARDPPQLIQPLDDVEHESSWLDFDGPDAVSTSARLFLRCEASARAARPSR